MEPQIWPPSLLADRDRELVPISIKIAEAEERSGGSVRHDRTIRAVAESIGRMPCRIEGEPSRIELDTLGAHRTAQRINSMSKPDKEPRAAHPR
jgi:hypothetical protein